MFSDRAKPSPWGIRGSVLFWTLHGHNKPIPALSWTVLEIAVRGTAAALAGVAHLAWEHAGAVALGHAVLVINLHAEQA
jgi:hypothetical protein